MNEKMPFPIREQMTEKQFEEMIEAGLQQAMAGQGVSVEEAFEKIYERLT